MGLLLQGYDCTLGLARWIDRPFDRDCDIVQVQFTYTHLTDMLWEMFKCSFELDLFNSVQGN